MSNTFIALDLELEQPKDNSEVTDSHLQEEQIIQVGWVVFDRKPFKVLVTRKIDINIGVPLSTFIKKLTGIKDEDIKNGLSIEKAYKTLVWDRDNFQTSRIVRQWGGGDMYCLARELPPSVTWEFGFSGFNVKHMFQEYADMIGINRHCGLSKCVARLGLDWEGQGKHQAHIDALNTARVYAEMYKRMEAGMQCVKGMYPNT